MKKEAYLIADQLENECEPYVQLDQLTFIKAAKLLREQADLIQLIYDRLVQRIDGNNH